MMAQVLDAFACLLTILFIAATLIGLPAYHNDGSPRSAAAIWLIALVVVAAVDLSAVLT